MVLPMNVKKLEPVFRYTFRTVFWANFDPTTTPSPIDVTPPFSQPVPLPSAWTPTRLMPMATYVQSPRPRNPLNHERDTVVRAPAFWIFRPVPVLPAPANPTPSIVIWLSWDAAS